MRKIILEKTCNACPTQYEGFYKHKWIYIRYRHGVLSIEIFSKANFKGKCLWSNSWQIGDALDGLLKPYYYNRIKKFLKEEKLDRLRFKEYTAEQAFDRSYKFMKVVMPKFAESYKRNRLMFADIREKVRESLKNESPR